MTVYLPSPGVTRDLRFCYEYLIVQLKEQWGTIMEAFIDIIKTGRCPQRCTTAVVAFIGIIKTGTGLLKYYPQAFAGIFLYYCHVLAATKIGKHACAVVGLGEIWDAFLRLAKFKQAAGLVYRKIR